MGEILVTGDDRITTSRRDFLKSAGLASITSGVGGTTSSRDEDETTGRLPDGNEIDGSEAGPVHVVLGAVIVGWQRSPTNPTLDLQAGNRYRVTWENLDGATHDFTIVDADGTEILGTETMASRGETRSATFTASEEMDEYVCSIHPESMHGNIDVGGGNRGNGRTDGNRTGGDQTDGDGAVETHFELGGVVGGWQGYSPFGGETNPTLELEANTRYRLTWNNLDGADHDFAIVDADGTEILSTDAISVRSGTRSLRFTAREEMDQYVCTFHPETMRGEIDVREEVSDIEDLFERGPPWMLGGVAAALIGIVVGFAYLLSRYIGKSNER